MPIYFRNAPVREPFIYDSIGNHWLQDATSRPNGYPFYHYLQTESGCGRITIQGKSYLLHEQEGVLIAPSIRHSYLAQTPEWYTCFCTFSGTVEGSISKILNNRPILFTTKEQCRNIRALLQDAIQLFEHPPVNIPVLSVNCYQVLLQFSDVPDGHRRNRNLLQSAPHSGPAESSGICHAPISIAAVSAFSGLLGLRISDDLPHQPCQRASADSTADGGAGNRCADRLFRSESLYRHVPQKHRTDTVRVSENQIMLCAAACFISVH
mgnify:CR=1 FL=1